MSIINQIDNIINIYNQNLLIHISLDNLEIKEKIQFFKKILLVNYGGQLDAGLIKNYKMEHYYNFFTFIVDEINKIYKNQQLSTCDKYVLDELLKENLLIKLTRLYKGQYLLNKLNLQICKIIKTNDEIMKYLIIAAQMGTFVTFIFWLNKTKPKRLEHINRLYLDQIYILSIENSDDRLFKYILNHINTHDKLFFQKKESIITQMLNKLGLFLIPTKYQLKRLKILSQHISLVPYFNLMMETCNSSKMLMKLHKYYYEIPHTYKSLSSVIEKINLNSENSIIYSNDLFSILKTDEEKLMYQIIVSLYPTNKSDFKILNINLMEKIVLENYKLILKQIDWNKFILTLDKITFNKILLQLLTKNNLITKFVVKNKNNIFSNKILFFTKFLQLKFTFAKQAIVNNVIPINFILHKLRLLAKRKSKIRIINHKIKTFDLFNEIKNFKPKKNIPVLVKGSNIFQYKKQKFTNLPPRHLLPGEFTIYKNFILREKADGILINNLPIDIYPAISIINNYQIKAEYIEEIDLYLIFDINIPNTTVIERYNFLRQLHPATKYTYIEDINSINDFFEIFNKERITIKNFINNNQNQLTKWYPKFACMYNYKNDQLLYNDIINQIILEKGDLINNLTNSEPYKCDGLILSPLNGNREIKIKPKSHMSIDLLFTGVSWIDKDNNDWNKLIIKSTTVKKVGNIYRCYPKIDNELKFIIDKLRFDKKYPNTYSIVDNCINMIKYDWTNDLCEVNNYYYDINKSISSLKLIQIIKSQKNLLEQIIQNIEPLYNCNWLDLGCGKGKLVSIIKKYNPKNYLGLDIDIKQLVNALKIHDYNQNIYHFNPCDLSNNWDSLQIKWYSFNKIKYDYIVANFSLMHFCTNNFWQQLNEMVHENTKFIFNLVNPNKIGKEWSQSNSFLKIENDIVNYKFEWAHNDIKTELLITHEIIYNLLNKYNWKIIKIYSNDTGSNLCDFYNWWIIQKN
jgi:SAM-dependent methyltransferase